MPHFVRLVGNLKEPDIKHGLRISLVSGACACAFLLATAPSTARAHLDPTDGKPLSVGRSPVADTVGYSDGFELVAHLPIPHGADEMTADVWKIRDSVLVGYRCSGGGSAIIDAANPYEPAIVARTPPLPTLFANDVKALELDTDSFQGPVFIEPHDNCGASGTPARTRFWDVSNPRRPTLLSELITYSGVHNAYAFNRADGAYLLMALPRGDVASQGPRGGFAIVEITDPRRPAVVGVYNLRADLGNPPGTDFLHDVWANPEGTLAYAAWWDAGLIVLDITDVTRPRRVGQVDYYARPEWYGLATGNTHAAVPLVDQRYVVLTDEDFRVGPGDAWGFTRIVDLEDLRRPDLIAAITTTNTTEYPAQDNGWYSVHNPFIHGDTLYLSHYSDGIRAYDVSNPAMPEEIASFIPPDLPDRRGRPLKTLVWGVFPEDDLVYASDISHGLWIVRLISAVPSPTPPSTASPSPTEAESTATSTGTPTEPMTATATVTVTTPPTASLTSPAVTQTGTPPVPTEAVTSTATQGPESTPTAPDAGTPLSATPTAANTGEATPTPTSSPSPTATAPPSATPTPPPATPTSTAAPTSTPTARAPALPTEPVYTADCSCRAFVPIALGIDRSSFGVFASQLEPMSHRDDVPPDLTVDGETVRLSGEHRFGRVHVLRGGVLQVEEYSGPGASGTLSLLASEIRIDAGSAISADGAGYRGLVEGTGEGPGGGEGGISTLYAAGNRRPSASRLSQVGNLRAVGNPGSAAAFGDELLHFTGAGAGGAFGGRGGDGMYDASRGQWSGGRPYGDAEFGQPLRGSAGGAPPPTHHESLSLAGGDGGGAISLRARRIVVDGAITASGADGEEGEFDAAGGGSGGGVLLEAERLWVRGRVVAQGGAGGEGFELGGAGGGGRVNIRYGLGWLDPDALDVSAGREPCPGEQVSPNGCPGSIHVTRLAAPVFLPYAAARHCFRAAPVRLLFVVDTSSSMGGTGPSDLTGLEEARAVIESILAMTDSLRLHPGLIAFDDTVRVLVRPSRAAPAEVARAMAALRLGRGSRLDLALQAAGAELGVDGPAAVLVISDGAISPESLPQVAAAGAALAADGIVVRAVGVGAAPNEASLEAAAAGAPATIHPGPSELSALADSVLSLGDC